jgi:SPOR domain
VLTSPDGKETTRNLVSFEPGKGARVTGPRTESLPGGWSAAAIADWKSDIAGLPRVRPEQVAEANPPVGLAGPTDRSRNADEIPHEAPAPQRTMLAFHAPTLKIPVLTAPSPVPVTAALPSKHDEAPRYGAHIGSFSTQKGAERAWTLLGKKLEAVGKTAEHTVIKVDLGAPKGVMYRLLAGPSASKADVARLCETIKAEGNYCRVVSFRS